MTKPRKSRKPGGIAFLDYTDEIGYEICKNLSLGHSLTKTCLEMNICLSTIYRWFDRYPSFKENYTRAREIQADYLAEEIISISDEPAKEEVKGEDGKSNSFTSSSAVQRNKLRVDSRKWYVAKIAHKKYGDKIDATLSGANGGPFSVASMDLRGLSDEDLSTIQKILNKTASVSRETKLGLVAPGEETE